MEHLKQLQYLSLVSKITTGKQAGVVSPSQSNTRTEKEGLALLYVV